MKIPIYVAEGSIPFRTGGKLENSSEKQGNWDLKEWVWLLSACKACLRIGQGLLQPCPKFPAQVFPRLSDKGISMQPGLINGLVRAGQNGLPSQNSPHVTAVGRRSRGPGKIQARFPLNSPSAPLMRGFCFIGFTPQGPPAEKERYAPIFWK